MAATKVVISATIKFAHPDGTKLRKSEVARYLKAMIENDQGGDKMRTMKAVVRDVDFD